jgi:hypothetical protein
MRYIYLTSDKLMDTPESVVTIDGDEVKVYSASLDFKKILEDVIQGSSGQKLEDKFSRMSYYSTEFGDMNSEMEAVIKKLERTEK